MATTSVDDPVQDSPVSNDQFYVGASRPTSIGLDRPSKQPRFDLSTSWTEVLPGQTLAYHNSYEARVTMKNVTRPIGFNQFSNAVEMCIEEVKVEPQDSDDLEISSYQVLEISAEDDPVKAEMDTEEYCERTREYHSTFIASYLYLATGKLLVDRYLSIPINMTSIIK